MTYNNEHRSFFILFLAAAEEGLDLVPEVKHCCVVVVVEVLVKSVEPQRRKDYVRSRESERVRQRRETVSNGPEVRTKSRDLVEERQRCPLDANKTVPDKTKKHASNFSTTKTKNKGHAKYETESQE